MNASRTALVMLALALTAGGCASRPKPAPTIADSSPAATQPAPEAAAPSQGAGVGQDGGLAAAAGDLVFFALDSHSLDGEARSTLDRQAAWLQRNPAAAALIAGSADERGTREYNFALGARRAAAARAYLVERGVAAGRLSTVSYGKEKPLDSGAGEEAWAKNRNARTLVGAH